MYCFFRGSGLKPGSKHNFVFVVLNYLEFLYNKTDAVKFISLKDLYQTIQRVVALPNLAHSALKAHDK